MAEGTGLGDHAMALATLAVDVRVTKAWLETRATEPTLRQGDLFERLRLLIADAEAVLNT